MDESQRKSIEDHYGPIVYREGNSMRLGFQSFAEYYRIMTGIIFLTDEEKFYQYTPSDGLWNEISADVLSAEINHAIFDFAREHELGSKLERMRTTRNVKEIIAVLKYLAATDKSFFEKKQRYVHCLNGVLVLNEQNDWILQPFSENFHSRNQCRLFFDPQADCPRFKNDLLQPLLEPDDIILLQLFFGQCLLGTNLTQTIFLMTGSGGSGKGTVSNILELIVGTKNYTQIRPTCISSRFETSCYAGKTLLTGKESQTSFFTAKGMGIIKSLVGDDCLRIELKHSNEEKMIQGTYNVFIVGNVVPSLEFESKDEISAWRRRLRWIPCKKYKPEHAIDHFADLLFAEEGPGILNWCLNGAGKLLKNDTCSMPLDESQQNRLAKLFSRSFQLEIFVKGCLVKDQQRNVTVQEIYSRYCSFASELGWNVLSFQKFGTDLPKYMLQHFSEPRTRDIYRMTDGRNTTHAGFRHIAFK